MHSPTRREWECLQRLNSPKAIQAFLDSFVHDSNDHLYPPSIILQKKVTRIHCFEASLVAASALLHHGHDPVLLDLRAKPELDDDHVVAIYQHNGKIGFLSHSSIPQWTSSPARYSSIAALVAANAQYYTKKGRMTLESYALYKLNRKDQQWHSSPEAMLYVGEQLEKARHTRIDANFLKRAA